jgi:ribosomal peptide maturation radical SAM protein 1
MDDADTRWVPGHAAEGHPIVHSSYDSSPAISKAYPSEYVHRPERKACVLLVNMPFGGVDRPAIGISTLKAGLTTRAIECDIRYLNFDLARRVGPRFYQWFSDRASHMIFAGEWLFAEAFIGDALPPAHEYLQHLLVDRRVPQETVRAILWLRRYIRPYLQHCLNSVDWGRYGVIGFTSTFEQNLASLALAHAVKSRDPERVIVMGGANCEGSMGHALHRHFPFLDYVFTGAADHTFPEFVNRLFHGAAIDDIPGIVFRREGESMSTGLAIPVADLNTLPVPDYDDYFDQLRGTGIAEELSIRLQIETSRGCWWGMKHHCTFCGMNAATMRFGSKTKDRVIAEIEFLVQRYGIRGIDAVDAILDQAYYDNLLPELRDRDLGLSLFYEIKSNVTKPQVKLLSEAGVTYIQPGIESFHPRLLKQMRKGASPLQNVQLLKWSKQYGIEPTWNILYGFPGEMTQDYVMQSDFIRSLTHLTPPRGCGQIRMDRFSPHFERADEFGFTNVRALRVYSYIYPLTPDETFEVAYFFDYDHASGFQPRDHARELEAQVREWQSESKRGARLVAELVTADDLLISDTRTLRSAAEIRLEGWRKKAYEFCDRARPFHAVVRYLRQRWGLAAPTESEILAFLVEMVQRRLMAVDGAWYLSLAVWANDHPGEDEDESRATVAFPLLQEASAAAPRHSVRC